LATSPKRHSIENHCLEQVVTLQKVPTIKGRFATQRGDNMKKKIELKTTTKN